MKLTNNTTPQAMNYQCNKCKCVHSHKRMYDDNICESCYEEEQKEKQK